MCQHMFASTLVAVHNPKHVSESHVSHRHRRSSSRHDCPFPLNRYGPFSNAMWKCACAHFLANMHFAQPLGENYVRCPWARKITLIINYHANRPQYTTPTIYTNEHTCLDSVEYYRHVGLMIDISWNWMAAPERLTTNQSVKSQRSCTRIMEKGGQKKTIPRV